MNTETLSYLCSTISKFLAMIISGLALSFWDQWPGAVLLIVLLVAVPYMAIESNNGKMLKKGPERLSSGRISAKKRDMAYWINLVQVFGWRLIAPLVISQWLLTQGLSGPLVFGATLGFISLTGVMAGIPASRFIRSRFGHDKLVTVGAKMVAGGWLVAISGLWLLLSDTMPAASVIIACGGLVLCEIGTRIWAPAYFSALRHESLDGCRTGHRRHKHGLRGYMVAKNRGGATALLVAGVVLPVAPAITPALLGVGALLFLRSVSKK